jgi:hypothetical protein
MVLSRRELKTLRDYMEITRHLQYIVIIVNVNNVKQYSKYQVYRSGLSNRWATSTSNLNNTSFLLFVRNEKSVRYLIAIDTLLSISVDVQENVNAGSSVTVVDNQQKFSFQAQCIFRLWSLDC